MIGRNLKHPRHVEIPHGDYREDPPQERDGPLRMCVAAVQTDARGEEWIHIEGVNLDSTDPRERTVAVRPDTLRRLLWETPRG